MSETITEALKWIQEIGYHRRRKEREKEAVITIIATVNNVSDQMVRTCHVPGTVRLLFMCVIHLILARNLWRKPSCYLYFLMREPRRQRVQIPPRNQMPTGPQAYLFSHKIIPWYAVMQNGKHERQLLASRKSLESQISGKGCIEVWKEVREGRSLGMKISGLS